MMAQRRQAGDQARKKVKLGCVCACKRVNSTNNTRAYDDKGRLKQRRRPAVALFVPFTRRLNAQAN